jgi:transposase
MRQLSRVTMSMRELDRLKCVQAVIEGELGAGVAAERLGMSTRQIRRLMERYRAEGPMGLISRRYRRPSNNRLETALETQVVQILREHYADFGPTLAREKLLQRHRLYVGCGTLRGWMAEAGL